MDERELRAALRRFADACTVANGRIDPWKTFDHGQQLAIYELDPAVWRDLNRAHRWHAELERRATKLGLA
jgi:hypothetical protein